MDKNLPTVVKSSACLLLLGPVRQTDQAVKPVHISSCRILANRNDPLFRIHPSSPPPFPMPSHIRLSSLSDLLFSGYFGENFMNVVIARVMANVPVIKHKPGCNIARICAKICHLSDSAQRHGDAGIAVVHSRYPSTSFFDCGAGD